MSRQAIIIGAGPAGITAAYELVTRTDILPIVLERNGYVGGLARTHEFQGNRIDMGRGTSSNIIDRKLFPNPLRQAPAVLRGIGTHPDLIKTPLWWPQRHTVVLRSG